VIHAEVEAIDCGRRQVSVRGRPPLEYDLLSINIGSRPQLPSGAEHAADQFAVKPVNCFIESWRRFEQGLLDTSDDLHLAIIGGGAGGVELALSLQHRVNQLENARANLQISLVTDGDHLLPGHNARVRRYIEAILRRREITVHCRHAVNRFEDGKLQGDFGPPLAADAVIWVTSASAPDWLRRSGLALDAKGFIEVNDCLQSTSHAQVFAAGDIAAVVALSPGCSRCARDFRWREICYCSCRDARLNLSRHRPSTCR
jgi:selenide,water dikinase